MGSVDNTFALLLGSGVGATVAFPAAVGLTFGIYPAYKAAKKHPIEAFWAVG